MGLLDNLTGANGFLGSPDALNMAQKLMQMGQPMPMMIPDGHGGMMPNPAIQQQQQGGGMGMGDMASMLKNIMGKNTQTPQTPQQPVPLPLTNTTAMVTAPSNVPLGANPNDAISKIQNAIGMEESSNRYGVMGPAAANGQVPYGKYQVLASNVGPWTKQYLGQAMTPQQFLNDPQAQDAVAQGKMSDIYNKYGTPQDVAAVWFSGRPMKNNNAYDSTSRMGVPQYINRFNQYYNG